MTNGPVSGNGISLPMPVGKVVFCNFIVNVDVFQIASVQDASGNILFGAEGVSAGNSPILAGSGSFTAPAGGNLQILLKNQAPIETKVVWEDKTLQYGGNTYFHTVIFACDIDNSQTFGAGTLVLAYN